MALAAAGAAGTATTAGTATRAAAAAAASENGLYRAEWKSLSDRLSQFNIR